MLVNYLALQIVSCSMTPVITADFVYWVYLIWYTVYYIYSIYRYIAVLFIVLCMLVRISDPVPEEHQVEFIERRDHAVVLNVLRMFDSENVVLSALQVLIPLAEPRKTLCILCFLTVSVNVFCLSIFHIPFPVMLRVMEGFTHKVLL